MTPTRENARPALHGRGERFLEQQREKYTPDLPALR